MTSIANIYSWATKYEIESEAKVLVENGFDNLTTICTITEQDLEKMGIMKLGTKKN